MTNAIEDFENAPFAATATDADGLMAVKIDDGERSWLTPLGTYLDDEEMMVLGYTLSPPVATTVREALGLAWELAHPVKERQIIPKGTRFLEDSKTGLKEYSAQIEFRIKPGRAHVIRTFHPLPGLKPDWIEAPAVMARLDSWEHGKLDVFIPTGDHPDRWAKADTMRTFHRDELRDVVPLCPKGEEA